MSSYILFVRSSSNPGPRVRRVMEYLKSESSYSIAYMSPMRGAESPETDVERWGKLSRYKHFGGSDSFGFIVFLAKFNFSILKEIFGKRRILHAVHFSDLESILLGGLLCKMLGIKVAYNIHDNFFQRYAFSAPLARFLRRLEEFYVSLSYVCFVPAIYRAEAYRSKLRRKFSVVPNIPSQDISTSRVPFEDRRVRLFYGGWVSANRHLDLFVDLARLLECDGWQVEFRFCGWGDESYVSWLHNAMKEVGAVSTFLGQLPHDVALEELKASDVCIVHYDPSKQININAASKKIPEILGSNTILVTNAHTLIAQEIAPYDISLQYSEDVREVFSALRLLLQDEHLVARHVDRARSYFEKNFSARILKVSFDEAFNDGFL